MGSVTTIGAGAFQSCTSLTNVDMSSVETIGAGAFQDCTSLTNVDMSSATTIGFGAFQNCKSLANIRLGSDLPEVDPFAFSVAGSTNGTVTIYSDAVKADSNLQEKVREWFEDSYYGTISFHPSSEYPGAAAGNALAQYLTRLF